jgi:hypothetical protein
MCAIKQPLCADRVAYMQQRKILTASWFSAINDKQETVVTWILRIIHTFLFNLQNTMWEYKLFRKKLEYERVNIFNWILPIHHVNSDNVHLKNNHHIWYPSLKCHFHALWKKRKLNSSNHSHAFSKQTKEREIEKISSFSIEFVKRFRTPTGLINLNVILPLSYFSRCLLSNRHLYQNSGYIITCFHTWPICLAYHNINITIPVLLEDLCIITRFVWKICYSVFLWYSPEHFKYS